MAARLKYSTLALVMGLVLMSSRDWASDLDAEALMEPLTISVHNGALSVDVDQMPLPLVLEEIGHQANIEFVIPDYPEAPPLISAKFQQLSREQAIRQLLSGYNYVLEYPSAVGATASPAGPRIKVRILEGQVLNKEDILALTKDRIATRRAPLRSPDADARATALRALADEQDMEKLTRALNEAVHDESQDVREAALEMMEDMEGKAPLNLLTELALKDASPELRRNALELLADIDQKAALTPLQQALQDPDAEVRETASELLSDLTPQ